MKGDHGLAHDPFKAIVAPRPIGWISSLDAEGRPNLAPYSFFNAISARPHIVMFSSDGEKHSALNIEATGEFVCSLVTHDLRDKMSATSKALRAGESEFAYAGIESAQSRLVRPPRVAACVAALECKLLKTDRIRTLDGHPAGVVVVYGEVAGIYVDDAAIHNGRFDIARARTLARCGYHDYVSVESVFEIVRPDG